MRKSVLKISLYRLLCLFAISNLNSQSPYCFSKVPSSNPPGWGYQPTSCSQLLNDCAPTSSDPQLEVNVTFWVFAPTTNSASGAWTYSLSPNPVDTLQKALDRANTTFSTIPNIPNLPVAGTSTTFTNAKIKLVMKNYHFIKNDFAYYKIDNFFDTTRVYYDPNSLNVYLGTWTDVVTNTVTNVTYTIENERINTATDIQIPWGYTTRISFTPAWFKQTSPILHDNIAKYGGTLAHEVGHALGLDHTTAIDDSSSIILDTSFTYVKNPVSGCCSYAHVIDAHFEMANITTTACTSDNLMSQDAGCNRYLSPQQAGVMHFNLRNTLTRLLTSTSKNSALQRNAALDYSVTSNETWDKSNRYFKGNITVKTNKTLTIKCALFMPQYASIIIEQGAQLVLDGGIITNIAGRLWDGIHMVGNVSMPQLATNTVNPGSVLYNGMLRIKNGGTISQATIAVRNFNTNYGDAGGVIFAQNANFLNNVNDVQMVDSRAGGTPITPSASWFYNCNFKTNDTIYTSGPGTFTYPDKHILLINIIGVKFRGCIFQYTTSVNSNHGTGVYSWDASYTIDKNLNDSCLFENLDYAIYAPHSNPLKTPSICNSIFRDNRFYAAYIKNIFYFNFSGNMVRIGTGSNSEGLYLNQCKYYKVMNNVFNQNTFLSAPGVNIFRSKTGSHQVYRNIFYNLLMGINCMDDNGNASNSLDGLKMNCNRFNFGTRNLYDVVLSYSTGLTIPRVNKTQGDISSFATFSTVVRNIYGATCNNNQNMWQIYSGSTDVINHGANTNSLTSVTQPTATGCKSSLLNVVNKNISLDFSTHCTENPLSSGGTSTTSSQRLSDINSYISDLVAHGDSIHFELQAAVASKLQIFLTDSLDLNSDSVISILENNPGAMEDADVQTVFAYMRSGDYATALTKADDLGSTKPDWSDYLLKLIAVQGNTVDGIYSLNSNGTDRSFMLTYANTNNMDGQASAQALLQQACDSLFSEPHALPEGEGSRKSYFESPITSGQNEEVISIFPNPSQSGVTVYYSSSDLEKVKIECKDLVGKLIYTNFISSEQKSLYIPLENLRNGMYLMTLSRNGKIVRAEKLIKE